MTWIIETVFSSLGGWLGVTGIVVVICGAVAWFIPPLRRIAIGIAAVAMAATAIYAKGNRDRARLEARRKEEAVKKARKEYDKIDKRADTHDDVVKRMRDGGF